MTDAYPTRLKEILETEGRSQTWLAKRVGCTRQMVFQWANAKRPIAQQWHEPIAAALGRSTDDVFPTSPERTTP